MKEGMDVEGGRGEGGRGEGEGEPISAASCDPPPRVWVDTPELLSCTLTAVMKVPVRPVEVLGGNDVKYSPATDLDL